MGWDLSLESLLRQRWGDDWLVGLDSALFWQLLEEYAQQLRQKMPQTGLIAERDPLRFLAGFIAACSVNCNVFLGNPDWGEQEWQQVWPQCIPDWTLGAVPYPPDKRLPLAASAIIRPACLPAGQSAICIPTGGSSGSVTFAVHTWDTLLASVQGFQQHFGVQPINAYCVLPLYHVSGLMQALRAFVSGGQIAAQPFKALEGGKRLALSTADSFISLVPTQLQRLLHHSPELVAWLAQFRAVLLGGAPAWPALLGHAKAAQIPLALTYGMTETASQVATLLPEDFLRGKTCSGRPLPHAQIEILDGAGKPLPPGEIGQICIYARSLAWGYYPHGFGSQAAPATTKGWRGFLPGDLGYLDEQGYLQVVGRSSSVIITGGEKVLPEEVEAVLRATELVADVCVVGLPDQEWGQVVTAVYVPAAQQIPIHSLRQSLVGRLSRFKHPKRWVAVTALPRNAQGKVNRQAVVALAQPSEMGTLPP